MKNLVQDIQARVANGNLTPDQGMTILQKAAEKANPDVAKQFGNSIMSQQGARQAQEAKQVEAAKQGQGGDPRGLLTKMSFQPPVQPQQGGGQGITPVPPIPQVNGRSGPQPGLLSMAGISPPLNQPAHLDMAALTNQLEAQHGGMTGDEMAALGRGMPAVGASPQGTPNFRENINDPNFIRDINGVQPTVGLADTGLPEGIGQDQKEPPGIFSRIGSGLQSAGQSMGGYAEKLFNDPSRMAMLQGGLSMMNPNSYYDKQGFGSVFQGLQAGLGQAQAGHKGVLDRRATGQATELAKAKAYAAKHPAGKNPVSVAMGNGMMQNYVNGEKVGKPFKKSYAPKAGKVSTYKTITENTPEGRVRINYKMMPDGTKVEQSRSDITRLVSGMNETGDLVVKNYNETSGKLKLVTLKKSGMDAAGIERSITMLNELQTWEDLLKNNPISGSEIPGSLMSVANLVSESFDTGTPFEARAKVDAMKSQLKVLITPEFIAESKLSDYERGVANAAMGLRPWATSKERLRAIPVMRKLLRMKAGLPSEEDAEGDTGDTDKSFEEKFPDLAGKM